MTRQPATFGKRREAHTVIIARGESIRHFTVRPWMAALAGSALAAMAVGYLLATSYLVLRDDLIGATVARQARMQQAYEDRISALRAQVDRITSRQLLDQQLMENKVSELISRQTQLTRRHGRLGPMLERAGVMDETLPVEAPLPDARPEIRAGIDSTLSFAAAAPVVDPFQPLWADPVAQPAETAADRADRLFVEITRSLRSIEEEQLARVRTLTEGAYETADTITEALKTAGLSIDAEGGEAAGGPLVPIGGSSVFEAEVVELDHALSRLEAIKSEARVLPIGNPAPGRSISSGYGVRRDPLLGTPAFHSGMDFHAPSGTAVKAAAAGTVVSAGPNGGYGRMVEITHENGLSTRYAHLSRIQVEKGDKVEAGDVIGNVGSTGRSTGPHLHYEIRRNGDSVDPLRLLKAGKKIANLL